MPEEQVHSSESIELKIEPPRRFSLNLAELWFYRELFYFYTWRDIKVRYKQTMLGLLWVVLQPVITVTIFTVFFGRTLQISTGLLPYPLFVFSGLLFWNAFSASLVSAGNSMITNAPIIKKIYFPRLIIPLSAMLVAMLDMLVAGLLFLGMLLYYQIAPTLSGLLLYWPAAFLLMLVGTTGLSCWLSALTVKYRDVRYVVPFALQVMLFLSPVIYPISMVSYPGLQYVLALNPMYAVIEIFRGSFGLAMDSTLMSISAGSALLLFAIGVSYFKRTENYFADIA